MKYFIVLTLLCFITLNSCKQSVENKNLVATSQKSLPAVPENFIFKLYEEVDHIDYYFRYTSFSVSQDEKVATQAFISTLSAGAASVVSDTCSSPLRLTFLSQGNILAETEMYMSKDCQYVEYYIDGKKTYQSSHSEAGYKFLANLFQQAQNVPRPN